MQNAKKLALTSGILTIYCWIWNLIQFIIEGKITDRLVDNIVVVIISPIVWIAAGKILDDLEKDKERNKKK